MPARKGRPTTAVAGLTPRQEHAAQVLAGSPTVTAAAAAAGVSPSTLHRWLRAPAFRRRYRRARRENP